MNRSSGGQVSDFVYTRILQLAHSDNRSPVAALLAKLRRGIGKEPGAQPELWDLVLDEMPNDIQGTDERPSYGERAVHTALTLFALHQQGRDLRDKCMNEPGAPLGGAVRLMIRQNPGREEAIKRRFTATVTSDSYEELVWHLRGLVQLFRSADIRLDYPSLARDLYYYQFSEWRDHIRLQWGRQFYRQSSAETSIEVTKLNS